MIDEADLDGDGVVSLEEFVNVIQASTANNISREVLNASPLHGNQRNTISSKNSNPARYIAIEDSVLEEKIEDGVSVCGISTDSCLFQAGSDKRHKNYSLSKRGSVLRWVKNCRRRKSSTTITTMQ